MGLEPTASGATNQRSNQLSYIHQFVCITTRTSSILNNFFQFVNTFYKKNKNIGYYSELVP